VQVLQLLQLLQQVGLTAVAVSLCRVKLLL
jgi:hypothetical protein